MGEIGQIGLTITSLIGYTCKYPRRLEQGFDNQQVSVAVTLRKRQTYGNVGAQSYGPKHQLRPSQLVWG